MAKLKQIVLQFEDGTTHEVPPGYRAVYVNREKARQAGEREPWDTGPPRRSPPLRPGDPADPIQPIRDMGKDSAATNGDVQPVRCYDVDGIIVCP